MAVRTPQQDEVWRAFARQRGGVVVDGRGGKVKEIRFNHGSWTIVVDTFVVSSGKSSTTYSRARALVHAPGDLRFKLFRENVFTRLGKMLGMQDLHAGPPELSEGFVIKGNSESMVRSLLIDSRIYHPLLALKRVAFELSRFRGRLGNRPRGVSELRAYVVGITREQATLDNLFALVLATLDQLSRMGAITIEAVDYPL